MSTVQVLEAEDKGKSFIVKCLHLIEEQVFEQFTGTIHYEKGVWIQVNNMTREVISVRRGLENKFRPTESEAQMYK